MVKKKMRGAVENSGRNALTRHIGFLGREGFEDDGDPEARVKEFTKIGIVTKSLVNY
jgi:hypothetical protein